MKYVVNFPQCQVDKGHHMHLHIEPKSVVSHYPLELLCINFTKIDPAKDSKENVLVLTNTFSKFSQAFLTTKRKHLP